MLLQATLNIIESSFQGRKGKIKLGLFNWLIGNEKINIMITVNYFQSIVLEEYKK